MCHVESWIVNSSLSGRGRRVETTIRSWFWRRHWTPVRREIRSRSRGAQRHHSGNIFIASGLNGSYTPLWWCCWCFKDKTRCCQHQHERCEGGEGSPDQQCTHHFLGTPDQTLYPSFCVRSNIIPPISYKVAPHPSDVNWSLNPMNISSLSPP